MAQHTPGPWAVRGGGVIAPNEANPYLADLSSPRGGDVRDADARLIAAAPDLLAALEVALPRIAHKAACHSVRPASEWAEHGSASFEGCDCEVKVVSAAIAKARGEA